MKKLATLAVISAVALGACGASEKKDSAHASDVDRSAPSVVAFPDDFSNVASKCDGHGHRIFVTTHGGDKDAGNLVIVEDSQCR